MGTNLVLEELRAYIDGLRKNLNQILNECNELKSQMDKKNKIIEEMNIQIEKLIEENKKLKEINIIS